MMTVQASLRSAHERGADRIYGWFMDLMRGDLYTLQATDNAGKVYCRWTLTWPAYVEAVTYWQKLNAPPGSGNAQTELMFEELQAS